jgi:hypothetical protein
MSKERIVEEIAGRAVSAMDFVFAPDSDWDISLFASHGASTLNLAKEMPSTKVLLQNNNPSESQNSNQAEILPDLGHLFPGGMVLSKIAVRRLEAFWLTYGELLPIDVEGLEYYYYNVTNVIENVVDIGNSLLDRRGRIETPAFLSDRIPTELALFKIPEKKCINLYVSGPGFLALMHDHDLKIGVRIRQVWSQALGAVPPVRILDGYTGP